MNTNIILEYYIIYKGLVICRNVFNYIEPSDLIPTLFFFLWITFDLVFKESPVLFIDPAENIVKFRTYYNLDLFLMDKF